MLYCWFVPSRTPIAEQSSKKGTFRVDSSRRDDPIERTEPILGFQVDHEHTRATGLEESVK
ncbi:hypothetical protein C446_07055 [Halobiforma nitratireducens JCM 10879]|uniref:Uncharacterized protein n=1 Tax=Halobiforma nitratireducens JCM 10879 TaxID=1227454 RepID=M0M5D0_9EURY|nr:hypothetical protein C446_07055 [Halobiforma nitratireducens JCM 10879]